MPFTEQDVIERSRETQLSEDAGKRASATPLPGPLLSAFLDESIQVTPEIKVRRFVASDWAILQWLNSPIYKMTLESQKAEEIREPVQSTNEEDYELCWVFTHTPQQCRELKAKGRETFTQTATEEIADVVTLPVLGLIVAAISKQIVKSFETAIQYGANGEGAKKN